MDGFLLPIAGFSVIYGRLAVCREKLRLLLELALTLAVRRSGRLGAGMNADMGLCGRSVMQMRRRHGAGFLPS